MQQHTTGKQICALSNSKIIIALLVAAIMALAVAPALADQDTTKDLKLFYQQNCSGCHGINGSAVGADGKSLSGQDFTDQGWQQKTKDEKMVKTILNGKFFGLAMPKFKNQLSNEDAQFIVTNIIRLYKK